MTSSPAIPPAASSRRQWHVAAGSALFILGTIIALFLLQQVNSAQVEVALSEIQSGEPALSDTRETLKHIKCPAAIGPTEPETMYFEVTNPADTEQTAQISVFAGAPNSGAYTVQCEQTTTFAPKETRDLSCDVSAAGVDGSILAVEVPGIELHCGIAIIDGPGALDGMWILRLGFTLSLFVLLTGAGMWLLRQSPHGLFEWMRSILAILVLIVITGGASITLFVLDVYWKMVAGVFAFWGAMLLMFGLLILLAAEGIVMGHAARGKVNPPEDTNSPTI